MIYFINVFSFLVVSFISFTFSEMTWSDLGLDDLLVDVLTNELKFASPQPVQKSCIPQILKNKDLKQGFKTRYLKK